MLIIHKKSIKLKVHSVLICI